MAATADPPRLKGIAIAGAVLALLVIAALFRMIDHDEGQYVSAVALMRSGLPFRDFLYLQTPLQPLLLAPLAWVAEGFLFPALRIANAVMAAGAVGLAFAAIRLCGGGRNGALAGALLMAACHPFLFAATVARNDALPLLLFTAGLMLLLRALMRRGGPLLYMLAGIAISAAISTKISYGPPAAAAGLFTLMSWRRIGARNVAAFALGGITGLLPCLFFWLIAPEATSFGIFEYSLKAPQQWRQLNGQTAMLDWPLSIARLLRYLAQGPALVALGAVLALRFSRRDQGAVPLLLDMLIVAGLIAAILPVPTYPQYLAPLLPPLFIRIGLAAGGLPGRHGVWRVLFGISVLAGLAETAIAAGPALASGRSPPIQAMADAHWIGDTVRRAGADGPVAGLGPERLVDSGLPLDPRTAPGPFIFRMRGILPPARAHAFHVVAWDTFDAAFTQAPPGAIVVGTERLASPAAPRGLDGPIEQWARRHGYRARKTPSGLLTLYIRQR